MPNARSNFDTKNYARNKFIQIYLFLEFSRD